MRSKRFPHTSHSYSYSGIVIYCTAGFLYSLLNQLAILRAQHQGTVQPDRNRSVPEQRVVEPAQRELRSEVRLVVLAKLQQHQLSRRIQDVRGIERAALGFAPGARLLEERFLAEETDRLLDRHVFAVQPDADDAATEADEGFGQLSEADAGIGLPEALVDHHLLAVVRPAFDERRRREEDRLAERRVDLAQVLVVQEVSGEHLVDRD